MNWINLWLKYLFRGLPSWANKLECDKCQKCFVSPEAHFEHVMKNHGKW